MNIHSFRAHALKPLAPLIPLTYVAFLPKCVKSHYSLSHQIHPPHPLEEKEKKKKEEAKAAKKGAGQKKVVKQKAKTKRQLEVEDAKKKYFIQADYTFLKEHPSQVCHGV